MKKKIYLCSRKRENELKKYTIMTKEELQNKVKSLHSYNDAHEFQQDEHNRLQAYSAALAIKDAEYAIDECLQRLSGYYEAVVDNEELVNEIYKSRKKLLEYCIYLNIQSNYLSNF